MLLLHMLLQQRLIILGVHVAHRALYMALHRMQHQPFCLSHTAIQKYGAYHRFHCVRQYRRLASAARVLLAMAKQQIITQAEAYGRFMQRALAYRKGAHSRHHALVQLRVFLVELFAHAELQHCVTQKLQPFIVYAAVAVTLHIRRMCKGRIQKLCVFKFIANCRLQLIELLQPRKFQLHLLPPYQSTRIHHKMRVLFEV